MAEWLAVQASQNRRVGAVWWDLWPAMRVSGGDVLAPFEPASVDQWWRSLRVEDTAGAPARAAAALAVMDSFGDPVGDGLAQI